MVSITWWDASSPGCSPWWQGQGLAVMALQSSTQHGRALVSVENLATMQP